MGIQWLAGVVIKKEASKARQETKAQYCYRVALIVLQIVAIITGNNH